MGREAAKMKKYIVRGPSLRKDFQVAGSGAYVCVFERDGKLMADPCLFDGNQDLPALRAKLDALISAIAYINSVASETDGKLPDPFHRMRNEYNVSIEPGIGVLGIGLNPTRLREHALISGHPHAIITSHKNVTEKALAAFLAANPLQLKEYFPGYKIEVVE